MISINEKEHFATYLKLITDHYIILVVNILLDRFEKQFYTPFHLIHESIFFS